MAGFKKGHMCSVGIRTEVLPLVKSCASVLIRLKAVVQTNRPQPESGIMGGKGRVGDEAGEDLYGFACQPALEVIQEMKKDPKQ